MKIDSFITRAASNKQLLAFRAACARKLLALLLLLTLPTLAQAQFNYTTNNGTITITGYTGSGGDEVIPTETNGLPVTTIGDSAFHSCTSLTSIVIPDSVTNIGPAAFYRCTGLTDITIPKRVTSIGRNAFQMCTSLTTVTIPNSVTSIGGSAFNECINLTTITIPNSVISIGDYAFRYCTGLTNITIGSGVTSIGINAFGGLPILTNITIPDGVTSIGAAAFMDCFSLNNITIPSSVISLGLRAFYGCASLTSAYFKGNAPAVDSSPFWEIFDNYSSATVFYLPGTIGWHATFGSRPTAPWLLPYPVILTTAPNLGVRTNAFGFRISWAMNASVVVEASANLGTWQPVNTNALTDGWSYFSDPDWTDYPARFYRIRSP